jgi:hypothetical protein
MIFKNGRLSFVYMIIIDETNRSLRAHFQAFMFPMADKASLKEALEKSFGA